MNCLKCGRTAPDQTFLCPECLRERTRPVHSELTREQSRAQRIAALEKQRRGLRRALTLFVLLALLASAALAGGFLYTRRMERQLASQTTRMNSLETVISEQERQIAQTNALNNTLSDNIERDQDVIDAYQILTGLTPDEVVTPPQPEETTGLWPSP